jgi:hypothetical protein
MINLRSYGERVSALTFLPALGLFLCFSTVALGADDIRGWARNESRGQPAAGDEVILVRLDGGMQVEARAKTNGQGEFTFHLEYPGRPYVVQVVHQGVAYEQPASASDAAVSIQVFDVAPHVPGVTGSIEILRAETNGNLLHVSDMYEIKNQSNPPLTRAGERTFEVYLSANAKISSVLAAGPANIGVMISATPVSGEPGHYAVSFPLRPGATKFAFNYDVLYDGHAAFHTRHVYPVRQFAVMIPLTMKFSSASTAFELLATGSSRYQVRAANQLAAGEGPGFEVSGTGALPPLEDQTESQARSRSPIVPNPIVSAPGHAALPSLAHIDSRLKQAQPPSQLLVLNGVISVLLAACVLLVWRARRTRNFSGAQRVAPQAHEGKRSQPYCSEALPNRGEQREDDGRHGNGNL